MKSKLVRCGIAAAPVVFALACSSKTPDPAACGTSGGGGTSGASGTSGTSGASCTSGTSGSSGNPVVAQAVLDVKLVTGAHGAACPDGGKGLVIGTFQPPTPVANGAMQGGGLVSVECKVAASGSGFGTSLNIQLSGANGGLLLLSGATSSAGASTTGDLAFTIQGQTYGVKTCVFQVKAAAGQGIAAGRYWTSFTCANVPVVGASDVCDVAGEVRIENCTQ